MRLTTALIVLGVLLIIVGTVMWGRGMVTPGSIIFGAGALVTAASTAVFFRRDDGGVIESDRIQDLDETRQHEMIRGTSMHLRDMNYRYSIRFDHSGRKPFTAEVNTITLGFVPVIILDNHSDKQGYGYVAFPHDGRRWRGPGLPCGGDAEEAIAHAARCVSPLDESDLDDGDDGDDEARW